MVFCGDFCFFEIFYKIVIGEELLNSMSLFYCVNVDIGIGYYCFELSFSDFMLCFNC